MPWDRHIVLRAIGHTPLVPVSMFGDELPDVEVLAKMECLNPGGSLKDRPVLYMPDGGGGCRHSCARRRLGRHRRGARAATGGTGVPDTCPVGV